MAHEREVEVARARTIRIEGRAIFPPGAGYGASTQNDPGVLGDHVPDLLDKGVKFRRIVIKREADDVCALLRLAELDLLCGR